MAGGNDLEKVNSNLFSFLLPQCNMEINLGDYSGKDAVELARELQDPVLASNWSDEVYQDFDSEMRGITVPTNHGEGVRTQSAYYFDFTKDSATFDIAEEVAEEVSIERNRENTNMDQVLSQSYNFYKAAADAHQRFTGEVPEGVTLIERFDGEQELAGTADDFIHKLQLASRYLDDHFKWMNYGERMATEELRDEHEYLNNRV